MHVSSDSDMPEQFLLVPYRYSTVPVPYLYVLLSGRFYGKPKCPFLEQIITGLDIQTESSSLLTLAATLTTGGATHNRSQMELEGLERGVVQERVGRGPGVVHGNGVAGGDGGPLSVKRVL
jgi:hypothetical protein